MITYLAIPYSFAPELSFQIANEVAAELMQQGKIIFSPVSHSHHIANYLPKEQQNSHEFWMKQDLEILRKCKEVIIVVIGDDGHKLISESKGCRDEIKETFIHQIPIKYYQYDFEKK